MKLVRYYDHPALSRFSDLDRWFERAFEGFGRYLQTSDPFAESNRLRLAADLYEDDANFYARVELPGAKKEDVDLELKENVLTISYKRSSTGAATEAKANGGGREELSLYRSLALPDGVQADKIQAKLENGVLTVTLPRVEKAQPRRIEVK